MTRKAPPAEPMAIGDGEVVLFDPEAFRERYNAVAAMVRDGGLFVLQRDGVKFTNVEFINKQSAGLVSPVRGRANGTD